VQVDGVRAARGITVASGGRGNSKGSCCCGGGAGGRGWINHQPGWIVCGGCIECERRSTGSRGRYGDRLRRTRRIDSPAKGAGDRNRGGYEPGRRTGYGVIHNGAGIRCAPGRNVQPRGPGAGAYACRGSGDGVSDACRLIGCAESLQGRRGDDEPAPWSGKAHNDSAGPCKSGGWFHHNACRGSRPGGSVAGDGNRRGYRQGGSFHGARAKSQREQCDECPGAVAF